MKRNILHTLWLAAAVLLAASCSQEEFTEAGKENVQTLSFAITDGGYAATADHNGGSPAGAPQTRAVESGYTTEFTAGDACGLYIVRGGKLAYANVKLTATAATDGTGALIWQPADESVKLAGGFPDETYYLYYPYQEDMTGKTASTPAAGMSDDEFFSSLISDWQPQADQSRYAEGYTASDLMTATATTNTAQAGKLQLTFTMKHRMALAVIELPRTKYVFSNTPTIPDYTVPTTATFTGEARPCRMKNGTYRYLYNPATTGTTPSAPEIAGSYADGKREFAFTLSTIEAGHLNTYKVDGGSEEPLGTKEYTLQVGDYLLADGNLLPKDTELSEDMKKKIAAIVFWTPAETTTADRQTPASLADDKVMAADFPGCTHGLAVSLKDVSMMAWQDSYEKVADFQSGDNFKPANKNDFKSVASGTGATDPINYVLGYQNTQVLLAYNAYCTSNSKADYIVKPVAALADFTSTYPAPANSTGWFLPSLKELHILCYKDVDGVWTEYGTDTKGLVDTSLSAAGGDVFGFNEYWSSSEYADYSNIAFNVFYYGGYVIRSSKLYTIRVRAVCAF